MTRKAGIDRAGWVFVLAALTSPGAHAQAMSTMNHASKHAQDAAAMSEGEVRKVDTAQGKVTLRHGPLANLDMPAMTMVFTASDKSLLQGLKVGDKVRFVADKKEGSYFVTRIERAP